MEQLLVVYEDLVEVRLQEIGSKHLVLGEQVLQQILIMFSLNRTLGLMEQLVDLTLKVAKASEAMSKVETSTYLKKS